MLAARPRAKSCGCVDMARYTCSEDANTQANEKDAMELYVTESRVTNQLVVACFSPRSGPTRRSSVVKMNEGRRLARLVRGVKVASRDGPGFWGRLWIMRGRL
jgi:hypothetical protein